MDSKDYKFPEHQDNSWMGCVFMVGLLVAVLLASVLFSGCSTIKYVDRWHTEYRDTSTYTDVTKDTTIYVPIPLESNQVIVSVGDTSKLETSVATSTAFVGGDGLLHHTLENKREKLPAVVPIHTITIKGMVSSTTTHTITKVEYKEKPLTWWQKAKIGSFWYLCGAVFILLCYVFRKPLLALLKLIFKL